VGAFEFEHFFLDLNTTTRRDEMEDGVVDPLSSLSEQLTVHLLSAN
jgi:hypothetical protein